MLNISICNDFVSGCKTNNRANSMSAKNKYLKQNYSITRILVMHVQNVNIYVARLF